MPLLRNGLKTERARQCRARFFMMSGSEPAPQPFLDLAPLPFRAKQLEGLEQVDGVGSQSQPQPSMGHQAQI